MYILTSNVKSTELWMTRLKKTDDGTSIMTAMSIKPRSEDRMQKQVQAKLKGLFKILIMSC